MYWRSQYLHNIDVRDHIIKLIDARRELDESFTVPRAQVQLNKVDDKIKRLYF